MKENRGSAVGNAGDLLELINVGALAQGRKVLVENDFIG